LVRSPLLRQRFSSRISLVGSPVLDLADELGITQQAANNRLKLLLNSGALVRTRSVPERGGMEFVYEVPGIPSRRSKAASANGREQLRRRRASPVS
jgi:predicted ArsR family transcriptional regulator